MGHNGVPPKAFLQNLPNITKLLPFVKFPKMILEKYRPGTFLGKGLDMNNKGDRVCAIFPFSSEF